MPDIVGVRFKQAGKVYFFNPSGYEDLSVNEWVIVETARGTEAGRVIIAPTNLPTLEVDMKLKSIIRRADWRDLTEMARLRLKEPEALATAKAKVAEYDVPMKLIHAEYNFDGGRLTFYFSSEKRVDFRDLVRDLAKLLQTRIELRQIGVRDEAKLLDGVGKCGLALCCSTWLTDFPRVTIKSAKNQGLPLNPTEISGVCGRLLCCLTYENEHYTTVRGDLPKVGTKITGVHGSGEVSYLDLIHETATITWEDGETIEVNAEAFRELAQRQKKNPVG